ncbi:MAG: ribbon-helix-helix domain-containing protein [Deltaproteobacteria bacterium]|nr:ribbon-helix-helix domain-containing protein [Deltaproteobacteria bacterium]
MVERKIPVSVSFDPNLLEELDRISARTKIPRSVLIRDAVASYIEYLQPQRELPIRPLKAMSRELQDD